jgi:hypothetical protein
MELVITTVVLITAMATVELPNCRSRSPNWSPSGKNSHDEPSDFSTHENHTPSLKMLPFFTRNKKAPSLGLFLWDDIIAVK